MFGLSGSLAGGGGVVTYLGLYIHGAATRLICDILGGMICTSGNILLPLVSVRATHDELYLPLHTSPRFNSLFKAVIVFLHAPINPPFPWNILTLNAILLILTSLVESRF